VAPFFLPDINAMSDTLNIFGWDPLKSLIPGWNQQSASAEMNEVDKKITTEYPSDDDDGFWNGDPRFDFVSAAHFSCS
jgi:hypothetical protein